MLIKGKASDITSGAKEADTAANGGNGKPDKNDFWVFNASDKNISVFHHDGKAIVTTPVKSGEIVLIDNGAPIVEINANHDDATEGHIGIDGIDGFVTDIGFGISEGGTR